MNIYTDGSALYNGKPNCVSGYGIHFDEDVFPDVSQKVTGSKHSNNIAELTAIIKAIEIVKKVTTPITIYTDSKYSILCATTFGKRLSKNNWKDGTKIIPNLELVKELYESISIKPTIQLKYIEAHTEKQDIHSIGNEIADKLAKQAISMEIKNQTSYQVKEPVKKPIEDKIYIKVTFQDKDKAKSLKAKWDPKEKKWYTVASNKNNGALFKDFPAIT
jgi:ribonuclease HI